MLVQPTAPARPLKHYNRLWLSWSHSAQMNVQIEPLLLHFRRTSFIVHALAKWFKRSNYSNSTFRAEVSWRKSKPKNFSLFWSFFVSRFPSFSFPFGCFFYFISCRVTKRFLSAEHNKKSSTKNFYNFNFYGLRAEATMKMRLFSMNNWRQLTTAEPELWRRLL